jgi:cell division transport system permease protein
VRRFTLRSFAGAAVGATAGLIGVAALPAADAAGGFLTGLGFTGLGWLWPFALPPLAAIVAFLATRRAAFRKLRELT